MTLCLAWKQGEKVFFASDSRLTQGDTRITDIATKIFKIGVEIYGTRDAEAPDLQEQLLHRTNFGFCFTGSYLNGSLLADTMEEVLSNLQGAPEISDLSINNLSDIAFTVYKQISTQLMEINREKGRSEVLLGGFCPVDHNFRLYKFSSSIGQSINFIKEEIALQDRGLILIGDQNAKDKANELAEDLSGQYTHFHLLRDLIKDTDVPTVGGNIQAGLFSSSDFKTYGIAEYFLEENEDGLPKVKYNYKFRGLSLDFDDNELRSGYVNVKKNLFNPFENERIELYKQVDDSIEKSIDRLYNTEE